MDENVRRLEEKRALASRHLLDARPERLRAEAHYEEVEQSISTLSVLLNSLQQVDGELDDAMDLRLVGADFASDVKEHFDRVVTRVVSELNDLFRERERALDRLL